MLELSIPLLSDSALIEKLQAEDSKSHFRALVERHLQRLWRIAYNVLQDANEAEDVVQEVFVAVWNNRMEIDESKASFATWVYRITMNRAIDVKRKRRAVVMDTEMLHLTDPAPQAEAQMESAQTNEMLLNILGELPTKQSQALKQFYYEERSVKEISAAMSISEEATRALLKRGRQSMRKVIDSKYAKAQLMQVAAANGAIA